MGDLYVGLDPSITNTGIVVLDKDNKLVAFKDGSSFYKGKKNEFAIQKYLNQARGISDYLGSLREKAGADRLVVVLEDYAYSAINKSFSLGEYGGILRALLLESGNTREMWSLAPPALKRFATGNGGAGKEAVAEYAVRSHDELKGQSNDVTDAYFLALYALYLQTRFVENDLPEMRRMRVSISAKNPARMLYGVNGWIGQ